MNRTAPKLALRLFGTASLVAVLAACASTAKPVISTGPAPVLVNPGYQAGYLNMPDTPVPSIDEIVNRVPSKSAPKAGEDRLRSPAMRDAALAYGAQGGLAWESREINKMLQTQSADISRTYDFQRVMIKGPDNVMIMPPVISEIRETWESSEAGRTLRVADTMYEIVEQATFAPVAPLWHTYLMRAYDTPSSPPDLLLPRDKQEREGWKSAVVEGWAAGRQQAQDIFKADLERLERDFTGMVRYKALLEEGKVSAPVVSDARLGTTGTGQDMRVNDRAIRIMQDPSLQVGTPGAWQATPTTTLPSGQPTGANPAIPRTACPEGSAPANPQVSSQVVCVPAPIPQQRPSHLNAQPNGGRAAWSTF